MIKSYGHEGKRSGISSVVVYTKRRNNIIFNILNRFFNDFVLLLIFRKITYGHP